LPLFVDLSVDAFGDSCCLRIEFFHHVGF
jgi:hypothetical protein